MLECYVCFSVKHPSAPLQSLTVVEDDLGDCALNLRLVTELPE